MTSNSFTTTRQSEAAPADIINLLSAHAAAQPDALALEHGSNQWSYAAFDAAVTRLARHFRRRGVTAQSRVALALPRSAELVLALFGVLRAGGAYVPLDPDWPEARRAFVIAATEPTLTLDPATVAAFLREDTPDVALPTPQAGDAAYILFTSGSTGMPKGVVVERSNLAHYVSGVTWALGLNRSRRFALTATVAADLGNTTLFGAFAVGGALVVADAADMADGPSFARFVAERQIDCLKIVPSHLAALLDTPTPHLPETIILGGEPTANVLVRAIRAAAPATRIFNHYGPTETTVGVMVYALPAEEDAPTTLPLDTVLPGSTVTLRDSRLSPVPVGAVGELVVGGAQVARGYLNPSDDAASPFVADPDNPDKRLYRTGDLARLGPDGRLTLLGRADDQVKIRGFRVELAELEAALLTLPGVTQAAAKVWGEGDAKRLCGYVVADGAVEDAATRERLRQTLPDAMVPAVVLSLPSLPRLGNGKIDRKALPEPKADESQPAQQPQNPLERLVARLIGDLLTLDQVGRDDNFFDIGGHSLMVIKLASRLRKRLSVEVTPGLVFDHPTSAALAATLAERLRDGGIDPDQLDLAA